MIKELKFAALTAVIALTITGCASNPDSASSLAADAKQSETITQINNLKQAIDAANQKTTYGIEEELDWFATKEIKDANDALTEAKDYYAKFEFNPSEANSSTGFFSSTTNITAAEEGISKFNEHMTKAINIKAAALSALAEAFEYRTQLKKIDAQKYFPSTVKELEGDLKKLVDQVSNDKVEAAINSQPALIAKQRALEIKTVTAIYLTDAQKELDRLVKANTAQDAPKSLSQASASLTAAIAFVAAEPRSISKIELKAEEAIFSIKRAEQIALTVKKLKALQQKDYEDYIINYEKILFATSNALGADDSRDLSFEEQGKALVVFIEANLKDQEASIKAQQNLQKELKNQKSYTELLEEKISTLNTSLADVKKSLADLRSEKAAAEQATMEKAAKAKQVAAEQEKSKAEEAKVEAKAPAEIKTETEQAESTTPQ
uniref:Lipoprotein n=1 Tax=Marinomonas sp. (strain MWYL1) TaxID=400668 RepID=A6VV29_MARMS